MSRGYRLPWLLSALLFLIGPAAAEYKLVQAPDPADPMQVHIYRLDNGLTVYLTENHQEPRFYAQVAVRAGSKNDPADATGLAHYMEHMLFKGTGRMGTLDYEKEKAHLDQVEALYEQHFTQTDPEARKAVYARINQENQLAAQYAVPNEIDRLYDSMGGRGVNAGTWEEGTLYEVDLPSNHLDQWARIESERFSRPVFRLFQTELETVYEEKNRSMDNKDRLIRESVDAVLYRRHPYGRSILGTVEHLKNPSLKRMYEFYHTYYVPNNMAVLLSGDIDVPGTIELIDAQFSAWRPGKLPPRPKWKEESFDAVARDTVYYPGEEYVLLAFRTAPKEDRDAEALMVLDMVLDNSVAGLINLNLNQQQRVRQAGSYPEIYNDYGAQYLWGIPKQDQSLAEVERLLLDQVELIRKGGIEDWIIPAIVTDFKKQYKQRLEANSARVGLMLDSYAAAEDWPRSVRQLERMGKLTKRDIVRVANRYFKTGYVAGYRLDGKPELPIIEKPALDPIEIDPSRQSAFARQILSVPVAPLEPVFVAAGRDFQVEKLRQGVDLYYAHNPLNDLFTFSISVDVGNLADNRLPVARELLDKSGTPHFSAEQLKKEWYKLGTEFGLSVGDQETTLSLTGLDENFGSSLALLAGFLQHPTTTDSVLAEQIRIILAQREDALKDHRTISQALYQYNRWGDNAYYRRVLSNQQLQELSRTELVELVSSLLGYHQAIAYAGSLPLEQVRSQLAERYVPPDTLQAPPPYRPLPIRQADSTEIYFYPKEMAQALVRLESGDLAYEESWIPDIQLYNEYFYGGMSGIVFQELRESRALAYQVWAQYFAAERKEARNFMAGFIGCQADKTPEAVAAFVELLDRMPESPDRFAAARESALNQYRTNRFTFRDILGTVRTWERQGLTPDPRAARYAQVEQADMDRMLSFYRDHVQGRPRLISIVGDKSRIDMAALARQGKVIELGIADLFAF
jgi:predicted Zn-dependent peptidase